MLRLRSEMSFAASSHFREQGFVNVQTPIITTSDCEGAGEVFKVVDPATSRPPLNPSSSTPPAPPPPPEPSRYLTVSSQLHLEALAQSLSKVFTLSPAFRAENSDTARHLQEFWMLEAEVAFLPESTTEGMKEVMDVAEDLIKSIARAFHASPDSAIFYRDNPVLEAQNAALATADASPFIRITYDEAIDLLSTHADSHPDAFSFKPEWGASLKTEHERWLADSKFQAPVFVTDYPSDQKPWYMLPNESSSPTSDVRQTVACFDLLVPRVGELIGGSLREHRRKELVSAMEKNGVKPEEYEWYLDLRDYGTTRHGGFGMGWERLVAWLTGQENVRECIAFPRAAEGSRF
ncbi:asparaginyl-trna synthetase [Pseudohyphozyma bogoriensis]|nr:asparaginyl-trna synthetase [Pseudohyphozyma bogoriensis]